MTGPMAHELGTLVHRGAWWLCSEACLSSRTVQSGYLPLGSPLSLSPARGPREKNRDDGPDVGKLL